MNDLINRHGVAAWLENMGYKKLANYIMDENRFPPASPEPKIGEWIFVHPLQKNDSGAYMCSYCKNSDWDIKLTDKFCKFCGAKMLKEGDGDNETN